MQPVRLPNKRFQKLLQIPSKEFEATHHAR